MTLDLYIHTTNKKHVRQNFRTMDRGGAPRASPDSKRCVPGAKDRSTNRPPTAGEGGRAEEATGDEAGDRARSVGDDGRKSGKSRKRKKGNGQGQGEERLRCAGFGHGGGGRGTRTKGRGKGGRLGEAEDQLGGGFGRRVSS
jgi:hypothetical protein